MSTADFDREFAPLISNFAQQKNEAHVRPVRVISMEDQRIAAEHAYRKRMNTDQTPRQAGHCAQAQHGDAQ